MKTLQTSFVSSRGIKMPKSDYVVYYFGIKDWHDVYRHDNVADGQILKKVKGQANQLGASAFILHTSDGCPLCLYEKKFNRWHKKW